MNEQMVRRMKKQLRGVAGRVSECVGALASTCARVSTIDKESFLSQAVEMFDILIGSGGEGVEGSDGGFYAPLLSGE